jgi:general secretion pathway protein B
MSFILDALKKSESDRQRQHGPALFEVRVAPPRTRLPLWAIAIAALLVVNLGVVLWMLLRHQWHASSAPGPQSVAATAAVPPSPAGPVPVVATSAPAAAGSTPPAPLAALPAAPGIAATPGATSAAAPATVPAAAPATASTAASAGAVGAADSSNAEDYTPAEEPPASGLGNHVRRATASGVPLYQDVSATPGTQLPQLRLDLHVFAAQPQDRFVMINMHKLREGDTLPEGVHVDSITPEGAVLSYNGSKFLLPRD